MGHAKGLEPWNWRKNSGKELRLTGGKRSKERKQEQGNNVKKKWRRRKKSGRGQ
jgi:hypothetical protein